MVLAQDLRDAVLQAAMQGKLTRQLDTDGSVDELLEDIKEALSPTVKSKRRKSKQMNIDMFDIPQSWRWVKLSECGTTNIGLTYSPQNQVASGGIIVLRSSNIKEGKMIYDDIVRVDMNIPANKICHIGDILICARNGSKSLVGKSAIIDAEGMAFGAFMAIYRSICNPYIHHVLNSPHFRKSVLGGSETTTINQVTQDMIENYVIPLPPIEEQQRIVERVNTLMAQIDEYEKIEQKLVVLKADFPRDMRAAILQAAMQGNLTEQFDTDSSVDELLKEIASEKEKLLANKIIDTATRISDISVDELPFDIPHNWRWVRWGNLSYSIQYGYNAPAQSTGNARMVRISDVADNKIIWDNVPYCSIAENQFQKYQLFENDLLFARTGGTVGKSVLAKNVPSNSIFAGYLIRSNYSKKLSPCYLKYFMESELYWRQLKQGTTQTAQPNCNGKTLSNMLIPLPPIEEQHRIVDRLDALLPMCDDIAS